MTVPPRDGLRTVGRRGRDSAKMATTSPLPPPEEVFADWLISAQSEACLEAAARRQIEVIDRSMMSLHPSVQQLRLMLLAVANGGDAKAQWGVPDR